VVICSSAERRKKTTRRLTYENAELLFEKRFTYSGSTQRVWLSMPNIWKGFDKNEDHYHKLAVKAEYNHILLIRFTACWCGLEENVW